MKKGIVFIVVLMFILSLSGCGTDAASDAPAGAAGDRVRSDSITFAQGADITSLDPTIGRQLRATTVTANIFDRLVEFDENLDIAPSLAESWERLSDTSIKFFLRQGVRFHNGDPFTAADVKFSFERAMASPHSARNVAWMASVEVIDDFTVIVHSHEPFGPFLASLTIPPTAIVPKGVVEADEEGFALHPIGTGPYKFLEWRRGEFARLVANDDHWRGAPETRYITMRVVPEASQRTIMLQTGEIDIAYEVLPSDVARILADENLNLLTGPSFKTIEIIFNTISDGPVGNRLVRQAIERAIDKQEIVDYVVFGLGVPGSLLVAPISFGFSDIVPANKFDLEEARRLMEEAGFPDGFSIELWTYAEQNFVELAQVVQNQLAQIDIDVTIVIMEYGSLLAAIGDGADYDMQLTFWNSLTGDADFLLTAALYSTSGGNDARYNNPEVDRLILEARNTVDPARRQEIYNELFLIIAYDTPQFSIYYEDTIVATTRNIENFRLNPMGFHFFRDVIAYEN